MSTATLRPLNRAAALKSVRELFATGKGVNEIAAVAGLPIATVSRWLKAIRVGEVPKTDADRFRLVDAVATPVAVAAAAVAKAQGSMQKPIKRVGPSDDFPRVPMYPSTPADPAIYKHGQANTGHAMTWADVRDHKQKKVVITSAQMATPVHAALLQSLRMFCFRNAAALIVVPFRYKNPTSQWTAGQDDHEWVAPDLERYVVDTRERLNKNLILAGDIPMQPTATSPLSGLDTMGPESMIFGHPRLELATVPVPSQSTPKIVTTTGCVTVPNYSSSKAGKKGEFNHSMGAILVEIDGDKIFHLRQLCATKNGEFIDLSKHYSPFGAVDADDAAALILGDTHTRYADPLVHAATFGSYERNNAGRESIVQRFFPKIIAVNDLSDLQSNNTHHHKNDFKTQYKKHFDNKDVVETEIDEAAAFLDGIAEMNADRKILVVPSNHTDHLSGWMENHEMRRDPKNARFWLWLWMQYTNAVHSKEKFDAFIHSMEAKAKHVDRLMLPYRDDSISVLGIEIGMHGDKGPNGARGSRKNLDKIGVKSVVGHSHSPGIFGGCWQVGTSSLLRMDYNSGPSSWMHTHCIIYANGQRTLINIVNGEWRMHWDASEYYWASDKARSLAVKNTATA